MFRALVAAVVLALLAGCRGGGDDDLGRARAAQARRVARDAGLPPAIQEFFADAAAAVDSTYSVSYALGAGGGRSTVVQDPPKRRLEFSLPTPSTGVVVTRVFITNGDGVFGCAQLNGKWACQRNQRSPTPTGLLALGDVQEATQDLAEATANYSFRIERRTIARVAARCLITELKPGKTADATRGERGVLCISTEGVPLLIDGREGTLTATSYRPTAADVAFELPARPRAGPTTTR